MESRNIQESTEESIKRHHEVWKDLLREKSDNLKRRTDREITGVELDRLDGEIDKKISQVRREINDLVDQTKVEEPKETGNGESAEIIGGGLSEGSNGADIEQSSDGKQEVGDSMFEKLSGEKLYVNRIETSHNLRSLVNNIAELGDITSSSDGYVHRKEDIFKIIGNLKDDNDPELQKVTRTYGLRDKVKLLLLKRRLGI